MHRRVLLLLGVATLAIGMVAATPANAASGASLGPGQTLGQANLVHQSKPENGRTDLHVGDSSTSALTDDPVLDRTLAGIPQSAGTEFPRNSASSTSSSTGNADVQQGTNNTVKGLNAHDLGVTHGFGVEPPDQGLCANSSFIVEMTNLNIKVFDSKLNALSGPIVLETFFGDPIEGPQPKGGFLIEGDPRCVWDPGTSRWFLSQLAIDVVNGTSVFQVAASTSSNPLGTFNVYTFDNTDKSNPGCGRSKGNPGGCLGDQPTMGVDANALFIDTNEFGIFTNEFNGAVIYTIDKSAMAAGARSANVVADFVGLTVPTPEWNSTTNCLAPTEGLFCWATIRPATSPTNDTRFGGTEYFLSALDFANVNDNRIAVWAETGTSTISNHKPSLRLFHQVLGSEAYVFPRFFVAQQAGPIPLGESGRYSCDSPSPCANLNPPQPTTPQAEGGIQPNDDQFGSAAFADGLVWGGLTTALSDGARTGIAYFAVNPGLTSAGLNASIALQNYLTVDGSSVLYPSIGVTAEGQGLISFTLTGTNFFPTSAYALVNRHGAGAVNIAALGQSPQDGFTEYQCRNAQKGGVCQQDGVPYRPRWGDYSASVVAGDQFVFSSEYIQSPNCSLSDFLSDPTHSCGGTRIRPANWGTSVNTLTMGED